MAKTLHPMWPPGVVEMVCRVIASTEYPGLTCSEIGRLLGMRGVQDVAPQATKWRRLEAALQTQQQHDRASNCIIRFIWLPWRKAGTWMIPTASQHCAMY
jgi:hypothetical protein